MHSPTTEFQALMARVHSGCPEAAQKIFDLYGPAVLAAVRQHLHSRLRTQFDSNDFAQSVWLSFFRTPAERYTFQTPAALVGFLSKVACHKVVDAVRQRLNTHKHDLAREQPLPAADGAAPGEQLPVRGPTPSQVAIEKETQEQLQRGQPAKYRQALEMLRQGYKDKEVAQALEIHPKTLQRLLQRLNPKG